MKTYIYKATKKGALTIISKSTFQLLNDYGAGEFKVYVYDTRDELIHDMALRPRNYILDKVSICLGSGWSIKVKNSIVPLDSDCVEVYKYGADFIFLLNKSEDDNETDTELTM